MLSFKFLSVVTRSGLLKNNLKFFEISKISVILKIFDKLQSQKFQIFSNNYIEQIEAARVAIFILFFNN